ncbi:MULTISPECIES: regulatory protein GemA [unclassified Roseibium]|uniref:regulatory protein GemA n=1 Tax=unclassified Roseibium TaxID=2629323 RepID=UPI00273DAFDA|nr:MULTISPECIES: regulatory protein GemA [unclassified Roseibium]
MSALARIHIAKKQLGFDDVTYRALLERITGKTSSKDMSDGERRQVLQELNRLSGATTASGRFAPVLRALWLAGYNLGVIGTRTDAALISFVRRQTGLDHTRFLHHGKDATAAIEGLKAWIRRQSGQDHLFVRQKGRPALLNNPRFQVVQAQWALLASLNAQPAASLSCYILKVTDHEDFAAFSKRDWFAVMNDLGKTLRRAKSK